jgi:hypothetical protein
LEVERTSVPDAEMRTAGVIIAVKTSREPIAANKDMSVRE